MTPQDEQIVKQWFPPRTEIRPTIVLAGHKDSTAAQMDQLCDRIKKQAPGARIKRDGDLPYTAPVMVVGRHQNIVYQAVPTGKILSLFLEALTESVSTAEPQIGPAVESQLRAIDLPIPLKLYVAAQCPHCPPCIGQLQALAGSSPFIRLQIIDSELFFQNALADQVRSVPTLILDDGVRWTGAVDVEELLRICIDRDPSRLSTASLRQLIEAGDAARVAGMMVSGGALFPALLDLLVHERWSVRLGAMVTAEYLADEAPPLARRLCEQLWARFGRLSPQVQGDVLQVLGQTDCEMNREHLRTVASGDYAPEVKSAAQEVLEEMAQ